MLSSKVQSLISEYSTDKQLPTYTSYGCCPIFYVNSHDDCLCADCANAHEEYDETILDYDANWENASLYCDHCSKRIESAYGEIETDDNSMVDETNPHYQNS